LTKVIGTAEGGADLKGAIMAKPHWFFVVFISLIFP
jgi:hypothetical protein